MNIRHSHTPNLLFPSSLLRLGTIARILGMIVILVMGALSTTSCSTQPEKEEKSIVVLFENDVHCQLDGYARMRGLADRIADTAWVAVVSSGDFLHGGKAGAISDGAYITAIMGSMRYDAVGLGNHEFDFGVPHMTELMAEAGLPVVSANLRTLPQDSLMYPPYVIKEYGGRKVAFLGVVTPESLLSEQYSFFDKQGQQLYGLCENRLIDQVQYHVDRAREQGADYVILLSHLGETSARGFITSGELVTALHGIDVVLDGHTHSVIPCDTLMDAVGHPVLIAQTGTKFINVGKLVISPSGDISLGLVPMKNITHVSQHVRAVTDSIVNEMQQATARPVCRSAFPLTILDAEKRQQVRYAETNAGNLVADAFRAATGAQLAVNNGGGIRSQLPAGEWTEGDIIEMLPYNNCLQVVRISGVTLLDLLNATTAISPREDGQFPQISGFRFVLHTQAKEGSRVSDVEVYDEARGEYLPLDPRQEYTLCTTDYCVGGGGMYGILSDAPIVSDNSILYNEAVITYLRDSLRGELPQRYEKTQGRIVLKK